MKQEVTYNNKNESLTALIDKAIAGDILGITPEAYHQRLSRVRRKVADFFSAYCCEYGSGKCRCRDRLNYAFQSHRLNPTELDYMAASKTSVDVEKALGFWNPLPCQP